MKKNYKYNLEMISEFDKNKPSQSAILTQEMADIVNERKNKLKIGEGVFAIFSQIPLSSHSKNKSKVINYLKQVVPKDGVYATFKKDSKEKEIEIDLIFFIAENYEKRDIDNFIKVIIDSLIGGWYDDDGQIKRVIAEKHKVNDMDEKENPKLYEQIYCGVKIL
ncbi:MAG: RusA family crossover junction endodeoxyribonuclease [Nanoarchaeota archaeon]|nr:RusA family crossover junction endodeoxyribonuclease [Nanoarchaeota archaeon]